MSNSSKHRLIYFLIVLISIVIFPIFICVAFQGTEQVSYDIKNNIKTSDYIVTTPIFIDDSDPNYNWSKTALENDWCSGSGSDLDPYIIMDVTTNSSITIQNSNVHFRITYCVVLNGEVGLNNVENGRINYNHGHHIALNLCYFTDVLNNNLSSYIYLSNSEECEIKENTLNSDISLAYCNFTTVTDNYIYGNDGINIHAGRHLTITGNTLKSVRYGIDANGISDSVITLNTFNSCSWGNGIELRSSSSRNSITNNIIKGCHEYGISLEGGDNIISNNQISHNHDGMMIEGSNNLISNNEVFENEEYGILSSYYYDHSQGNEFSDNEVYNNSIGIEAATDDSFLRNVISDNEDGIVCFYDDNVLLQQNILSDNTNYGIWISMCENCTILENSMYGCGFGIDDKDFYDMDELLSHDIRSNLVNDKYLYFYYNQTGLRTENFTHAGQVILWFCNDTAIENQDLSDGSLGFTLLNGKRLKIVNCDLSSNNIGGIFIKAIPSKLNISYNLLSSCGSYGLKAYYSNQSYIFNNTANGCDEGIYLGGINNSTISHNIMNRNSLYGLDLVSCDDNLISKNIANYNGEDGFTLWGCYRNIIIENEASHNEWYGIDLKSNSLETSSFDNIITRNVFLENGAWECVNGAEGNQVYDNVCMGIGGIFMLKIQTWIMFGFALTGSSAWLTVSLTKLIKSRKRTLKLK